MHLARRSTAQLSAAEQTNCAVSGVAVAPVPLSNYAVDVNIPSGLGASFDRGPRRDRPGPARDAGLDGARVARARRPDRARVVLLARAAGARDAGARRRRPRRRDARLHRSLARPRARGRRGRLRVAGARAPPRARHARPRGAARGDGARAASGSSPTRPGRSARSAASPTSAALATVAASATGDPSAAGGDGRWRVRRASSTLRSTARGATSSSATSTGARDPAALDPRLRAAADPARVDLPRRRHLPRSGCRASSSARPAAARCQRQLAGAATALAAARTNGALFLALPAGTPARTALSRPTSTRRSTGRSAGRTTRPRARRRRRRRRSSARRPGTWPRVGGLLLIVAGTLGMLLLFGFLALRLLGAALATLLYLLLAPLAVLAPALGRQRARHVPAVAHAAAWARCWPSSSTRSRSASCCSSSALLESLDELGWWTQWLLVSVFWWIGVRAPPPDALARAARARRAGAPRAARDAAVARRPQRRRRCRCGSRPGRIAGRAGAGAIETVKRWRELPQDSVASDLRGGGGPPLGRPGDQRTEQREQARGVLAEQVQRMQAVGVGSSRHRRRDGLAAAVGPGEVAALEARRSRLATTLQDAVARGDRRRIVSLQLRASGSRRIWRSVGGRCRAAHGAGL